VSSQSHREPRQDINTENRDCQTRMDVDEVNRLITEEVDEIEDRDVKQFVRDLLKFERPRMDGENYAYKEEYKNKIREYTD